MKRLGLLVACGLLWCCGPLADGGPVDRLKPGRARLESKERGKLGEFDFKGGERACVIVMGDHNPIVDLVLEIRDAEEQVVAKYDRGGDIGAAIWYPPRDGRYSIHLYNPGKEYNEVYVVIK
jgi:hypothetical protein